MIILPPITDLNSIENKKNIDIFNKHNKKGDPIFLFLYMDGCGPCNSTKESWKEIPHHINKKNYLNNVLIAQINKDLFTDLQDNVGSEPSGFPTLRYIKGKHIEEYESERTPQAFSAWIESKTKHGKNHHSRYHKLKMSGGRKWSLKYKRSIHCNRPKGFSQKQYCRKKNRSRKK